MSSPQNSSASDEEHPPHDKDSSSSSLDERKNSINSRTELEPDEAIVHTYGGTDHHHGYHDERDGILLDASSSNNTDKMELVRLVVVTAATAATLGYDVGIMAAAIIPLTDYMELNSIQKEVAMGSLNFVAAFGAILGGRVADQKGRKPTISLCCWLFLVGTACMALAPGFWSLLLGRIVTGIGVGVSFVVAPVFISEVAPSDRRGELNTVFDVAINGGILLGYVVGYIIQLLPATILPEWIKWRLMLGLGAILPVIVLIFLKKLPESPRWLMLVDQVHQARHVLKRLGSSEEETDSTIQAIQSELDQSFDRTDDDNSFLDCRTWGPGQWLAVGLGFWQQATGTEAVLYYSADFLKQAGLESPSKRLLGNVFVGICKLVPEVIAMRYVDGIGRKPLLLLSCVSLVLSLFGLASVLQLGLDPMFVVLFLCAVMASFSFGLGPFTFLTASENLGLSERAAGMTLCAASNRLTSGAVAMSAVSLVEGLGQAGFFYFYAVVGIGCTYYYHSRVTETAGQTLEELSVSRSLSRARSREDGGGSLGNSTMQQFGQVEMNHHAYSDQPADGHTEQPEYPVIT